MKECKICGNEIPKNNKSFCSEECFKVHRVSYFKNRNYNREQVYEWRKNRKNLCVDFKGGTCIICGYKHCNSALEFHHKDPSKKDFNLSHNYNKKFEHLIDELKKCVLVCSNCHREIHENIININDYLQFDMNGENMKLIKEDKNSYCSCGKIKSKNAKLCMNCHNKSQRKVKDRPSLEQLEIDVKNLGNCGTGRKYGVSEACIRKWIKIYKKIKKC